MGKLSNIGHALYEGRVSIDFVGRKWLWYGISALILLAAVGGLVGKGVNYGIEFQGGVEYQVAMPAGPGQPGQRPEDPRRGRAGGGQPRTSTRRCRRSSTSPATTTSGCRPSR